MSTGLKLITFIVLFMVITGFSKNENQYLNQLTRAEEAAGFELLFDGETRDNLKLVDVNGKDINWIIDDDALLCQSLGEVHSLCTYKKHASFELRLSMKLGNAKQNSGIFFRWSDRGMGNSWKTFWENTEFAIQGEPHNCNYPCHTGDNYSLQPALSSPQVMNEYNEVRIFANGKYIEFWLQNEKVNEFVIQSEEWFNQHKALDAITPSSFSNIQHDSGYICIQDHGPGLTDQFWIRNYRIRDFEENGKAPEPIIQIDTASKDSGIVSMDVAITGGIIRYTTDGSDPRESSTEYTESFAVKTSMTIKSRTFRDPLLPSDIVVVDYTAFETRTQGKIRFINRELFDRISSHGIIIREPGPHWINILDTGGKTVLQIHGQGGLQYDLHEMLKPGIYFVEVKTPQSMQTECVFLLK